MADSDTVRTWILDSRHATGLPAPDAVELAELIDAYLAVGELTVKQVVMLDRMELRERINWLRNRYGRAWQVALADRRRLRPPPPPAAV